MFCPFDRFFRTATACISTSMKFASWRFTRIRRFIYSRTIVFCNSSPIIISRAQAFFAEASAVRPVMFVNGASSQPTRCERFRIFRYFRRVFAVAFGVECKEVLSCPGASVSAYARIFNGLAVGFFVSSLFSLFQVGDRYDLLLDGRERYNAGNRPWGYVFRAC